MNASALQEYLHRAATAPRFVYPWSELPADQPLRLVGYGSLMNASSAQRTLAAGLGGAVLVHGVRRVFDYPMPPAVRARYPTPDNPRAFGVLNVYPTDRPADPINAVTVEVAPHEVAALRAREPGYDLLPVVCTPISAPTLPSLAYILSCPHGDGSLLPHPGYLALCLAGARSVSEAFAKHFLETTYLADRTTRLLEWVVTQATT